MADDPRKMKPANGGGATSQTEQGSTLTEEVIAEIRKEAVQQAAKWMIAAMVALASITVAGWWLYLKPTLAASFGGVPANAVIAFDDPSACEQLGDTWVELKDVAGRVIVGAGQGDKLTMRGFRERLGQEKYMLKPENLPPHQHEVYRHAGKIVGDTGVPGAGSEDPNKTSQVLAGLTGEGTGRSEPYEVMPPYIALYFCKKIVQ